MTHFGPEQGPDAADRLLAAAARLFATRGFLGVSVREIVQAAGVSRPVLYYHFTSKEGLLAAVVDAARSTYECALRRAATGGGSVVERIRRLARAHAIAVNQRSGVAPMPGTPAGETGERAGVPSLTPTPEMAIEWLQTLIAKGIEGSELQQCDPGDAACALLGAAEACSTTLPAPRDEHDTPDRLDRVLAVVLRGLTQEAGS